MWGIPHRPTAFRTEEQAQTHCPKDIVVWLDPQSGLYYFKGHGSYGRSNAGRYGDGLPSIQAVEPWPRTLEDKPMRQIPLAAKGSFSLLVQPRASCGPVQGRDPCPDCQSGELIDRIAAGAPVRRLLFVENRRRRCGPWAPAYEDTGSNARRRCKWHSPSRPSRGAMASGLVHGNARIQWSGPDEL